MKESNRRAPLEDRAKALEEFSAFTYEGAYFIVKNQPEVFERHARIIAERGTHEAERYLQEVAENPRAFSSRPGASPPIRVAGYASLLGFCLAFWGVVLMWPLVDWRSTTYGIALCVFLGVMGFACLMKDLE